MQTRVFASGRNQEFLVRQCKRSPNCGPLASRLLWPAQKQESTFYGEPGCAVRQRSDRSLPNPIACACRPFELNWRMLQMNARQSSSIAISLMAIWASVPAASFAATYSGEAAALKATALGINVALADTGALPSSGGNLTTSLARVNLLGLASADALSSSTSGSGTSSQSQSAVTDLSLLGGLAAADVLRSDSGGS